MHAGVVASNYVGNMLGARSAIGARNAAHVSALTSVVVGSIIMTALLVARNVSPIHLCIK